MLITQVERYISLRQALGYKFGEESRILRSFAKFAAAKGDPWVRASTATDWASRAPSPQARYIYLRNVVHLARFLHAEDPAHEVPSNPFRADRRRPLPYIYTPEEVTRLLEAAGRLRESYPMRRRIYATLLGLIAATGLRISEALDLRLDDILPQGALYIRRSKCDKSRLIPLHPTAVHALDRYIEMRRRLAVNDDHVFLSAGSRRISSSMVEYTFGRIRRLAGIAPARPRPPRIHDLRHTFATRALERCPAQREAVARHFVALAAYLGHTDIAYTYWYLEATPQLMADIAAAGEELVAREGL